MVFKIDIEPLIIKHKNCNDIKKLNDEKTFKTVQIGEMGELCWKNLIFLNNENWNYDISPESIVANGINIDLNHA